MLSWRFTPASGENGIGKINQVIYGPSLATTSVSQESGIATTLRWHGSASPAVLYHLSAAPLVPILLPGRFKGQLLTKQPTISKMLADISTQTLVFSLSIYALNCYLYTFLYNRWHGTKCFYEHLKENAKDTVWSLALIASFVSVQQFL